MFLLFFWLQGSDLTLAEKDLQRDKTSKPEEILTFAGVQEGMVIFDLLGGGGYYSEWLARKVGPSGEITLHNNQAYMPYVEKELNERLAGNRLKNVVDLRRELDELHLAKEKFDGVFFVLGFHDCFYTDKGWEVDPDALFRQVHDSLKPGGFLLIIDHSAKVGSGTESAQKLHRIDEAFAKKDLEDRGFKFIKESQLLRNEEDTRDINVFEPELRRKTDRFVLLFQKK